MKIILLLDYILNWFAVTRGKKEKLVKMQTGQKR